jgi:uncharacterized protein
MSSVRGEILKRLRAAESEHRVRIVYACESGSRAWGFASTDSDYDVRFIYARERDWYLSFDVERRPDVIEYPLLDNIDCSGWDIRKTLQLFTRSNGALLEWLHSPIKYVEHGTVAAAPRALAPTCMSTLALCYHYSHMARGNAREYVFGEQVRLKKCFYVLRPLLAIRYLEQGRGIPPVEFEHLVGSVAPPELRTAIDALLRLKRSTSELGVGEPIPQIGKFIEGELERHGSAFSGRGRPDLIASRQVRDRLNEVFREAIGTSA